MRCPNCGDAKKQSVKETRKNVGGEVVRRRLCGACRYYYTTVERVEQARLMVEKRDGRKVAFDRGSLYRSIAEATPGWHTDEQIQELIDAVASELHRTSKPGEAVPSAVVGELVARRLRELSVASHIRFALAYEGRRAGSGPGRLSGWRDARDVRQWLLGEYPQLEDYRPAGPLTDVVKVRKRVRKRFDRTELKRTTAIACKGRGTNAEVERLASDVANDVEAALGDQPIVTTGQISAEVLRSLRKRDDIAYLRYASVIKQFDSVFDYEAEAYALANNRRRHASRNRDQQERS